MYWKLRCSLTSTRAPLVICSPVTVSSERFMFAWSLYSSECLHIHLLKSRAKARGYCQSERKEERDRDRDSFRHMLVWSQDLQQTLQSRAPEDLAVHSTERINLSITELCPSWFYKPRLLILEADQIMLLSLWERDVSLLLVGKNMCLF